MLYTNKKAFKNDKVGGKINRFRCNTASSVLRHLEAVLRRNRFILPPTFYF